MTQIALAPAVVTATNDKVECPFCTDIPEDEDKEYETVKGGDKCATKLEKNMRAAKCSELNGKHFPDDGYTDGDKKRYRSSGKRLLKIKLKDLLKGGADEPTRNDTDPYKTISGFIEDSNGRENLDVGVHYAAHHIIPGNEGMAGSEFEKWAKESVDGSKVYADIGYSVNGAANGIMLPGYAEFHLVEGASGGRFKWAKLLDSEKMRCGHVIMDKTRRQLHVSGHDKFGYEVTRTDGKKVQASYAKEATSRCDLAGAHVTQLTADGVCPKEDCRGKKDEDKGDKYPPPFALVMWINLESDDLRRRITGRAGSWKSFVSPFALDYAKTKGGNVFKRLFTKSVEAIKGLFG